MAIVRCEKHPLGITKFQYGSYALPVGYPDTAAICGRPGCEEPGRVWLEREEAEAHCAGSRVFSARTHSMKVRVGSKLIPD
jgi:hypothetical protein